MAGREKSAAASALSQAPAKRASRSSSAVKTSVGSAVTRTARNAKVSAPSTVLSPSRSTSGRAADDPLAAERTRWLADAVGGGKALAQMLGVSASQTSRWAKGEERPGPVTAPLLIDLEHVLARVRLVWAEPAATTWMVSANAHLSGARPVDVPAHLAGHGQLASTRARRRRAAVAGPSGRHRGSGSSDASHRPARIGPASPEPTHLWSATCLVTPSTRPTLSCALDDLVASYARAAGVLPPRVMARFRQDRPDERSGQSVLLAHL